MKSVSDYDNDAARLQAAVASFAAAGRIQEKAFTVGIGLSEGPVKDIKSSGQATFRVALESPAFQRLCKIHLKRTRCFFEGLKLRAEAAESAQRVIVSYGGQFYDRDLPNSYIAAGRVTALTESPTSYITLARAYVGDSRTVLFEHDLGRDTILCDGSFGQGDGCTKQTPFTDWMVDLTTSRIKPNNLD